MKWTNFLTKLKIANNWSKNQMSASEIEISGDPPLIMCYLTWLVTIVMFVASIISIFVSQANYDFIVEPTIVSGVTVPGMTIEEAGVNITSIWTGTAIAIILNFLVLIELHIVMYKMSDSHFTALRAMLQLGMIPIYVLMLIISLVIATLVWHIFSGMTIGEVIGMFIGLEILRQAIIGISIKVYIS